MRKALAYLSQQGLFERKAHVGTRVKARTRIGRFLNEYNDIRGIDHYGNLYPRHIQNVERLVLNEETADRLGLIPGEEVIRFKNIRVAIPNAIRKRWSSPTFISIRMLWKYWI